MNFQQVVRATVFVSLGGHSIAMAEPVTATRMLSLDVIGVRVAFPLVLNLDAGEVAALTDFEANVDLSDLQEKLDQIVTAAGLRDPAPREYQSFDYKGTTLAIDGDRLQLKYHFRVDFEGAPATNGSIELWLAPQVTADALGLEVERAELNVSNDILRGLVNVLGLDSLLKQRIVRLFSVALKSPQVKIQMPCALMNAGGSFRDTAFSTVGNRPTLTVKGTLGKPLSVFSGLLNRAVTENANCRA